MTVTINHTVLLRHTLLSEFETVTWPVRNRLSDAGRNGSVSNVHLPAVFTQAERSCPLVLTAAPLLPHPRAHQLLARVLLRETMTDVPRRPPSSSSSSNANYSAAVRALSDEGDDVTSSDDGSRVSFNLRVRVPRHACRLYRNDSSFL